MGSARWYPNLESRSYTPPTRGGGAVQSIAMMISKVDATETLVVMNQEDTERRHDDSVTSKYHQANAA
jgi:hypothetical protein